DRLQNLCDLRRCKQRRSSATEIDRIDIARLLNFSPSGDLAHDCVNITRGQFAFIHARRKVAVRATRTTEGNVYVDSGVHLHPQITQITLMRSSETESFSCRLR